MTAECCPPDPSHEAAARHPLAQEVNQLHAEVCAGLADPKRIMILYALAEGPSHVNALAADLDLPQPLISRHLKVLRERGMVVAARCGPMVQYRLGDARLIQALDLLRAVLSAVFTLAWAYWLLRERDLPRRLPGALIMLAGAALIGA